MSIQCLDYDKNMQRNKKYDLLTRGKTINRNKAWMAYVLKLVDKDFKIAIKI